MRKDTMTSDMIRSLTLKVLVDDQTRKADVLAEHGLSFWIEADCCRILFDTGEGQALRHNVRQLGLNLAEVDAVAISHGHYDHTGGLDLALSECTKAAFFMHPDALRARYSRSADGGARSIGFPLQAGELLRTRLESFRWTRTVTSLRSSVFLTGEITRRAASTPSGGRFFLDPDCRVPDPFLDDQALGVETEQGMIVLLGCSHAGVESTLKCALSHSLSKRLRAVIGGMHLAGASEDELARLVDYLEELGPDLISPCHCSGAEAKEYLKSRFPAAYEEAGAGTELTFSQRRNE